MVGILCSCECGELGGGEELTTCWTAEEAQKSVRGLEENAIHAKYIELVGGIRIAFRLS